MGLTSQSAPSSLIRPGVIANASERPASPYEGQCIFQKDTDQFLVWNGAAWVIPNQTTTNPDGLELITRQSLSGTATNIVGCFSTTYDNYILILDSVSTSIAADIYYQWLSDTTPLTAAAYNWAVSGFNVSGGTSNGGTTGQTFGYTGITNQTAVAGARVANGTYTVFGPMNATNDRQTFMGQASCFAGDWVIRTISSQYNSNVSPRDGIRFLTNSAATMGGTVSVYGYRK